MKRSKIWLRLLAAAAAAVLMCCAGCDRPAGKIDFTRRLRPAGRKNRLYPDSAANNPGGRGIVCPAPAHRLRLGHVA